MSVYKGRGVYLGIQGYSWEYKGIQGYTGVYLGIKGIQGNTRVYEGMQEYTGVRRLKPYCRDIIRNRT